MAAGDGVSLPTTLAQLANVAKAQAREQQASVQTTPLSDQLNRDDVLKVQRVKEADEAARQAVEANGGKKAKRKRRRLKRDRKHLTDNTTDLNEAALNENGAAEENESPAEEQLGGLIDRRV